MFPTSAERAAKRQRTLEAYRKGSVLKVEVKNFMTYAHAVIEPGPRLNLVLGPNGTGKSSLVCALCVGLGGSTRLLGRAEMVSAFVRRGTKVGEVTITLASGDLDRQHTVYRRINADDNSSLWRLNGREVPMKDVLDLVKGLNIQLDNLCQFLPQDKVVEFARMKPVELLAATEEAVGDTSLKEMHERLIKLRIELSRHQASEAEITGALEQLRADNARAERSVQQAREKERKEQEAKDIRMKVPWAEYAESKKEFQDEKEVLKRSEASLKKMKERATDDNAPLVAKKKAAEKASAAEKKAREAVQRADYTAKVGRGAGAKDRQTVVEDLAALIESKKKDLDSLEGKSKDRQRRIDHALAKIQTAEEQFAAASAAAENTVAADRRQKELLNALKDLSTQQISIQNEIENYEGEMEAARRAEQFPRERLNRLSNDRMVRLNALDARFHGISRAFDWVKANVQSGRLRGPVLGPIAMEIECPDAKFAQMLETQIAQVWFSYFVCVHQCDADLMKEELVGATGYRPNVAVYKGDLESPLQHELGTSSEYARFGITNTLDEVFQAPMVIKKALNDNFYLSRTFVQGQQGDYEAFFQAQPRAQVVFTPNDKIQRRVSRYNQEAVSTMMEPLKKASFLQAGRGGADGGAQERRQLEEQIQTAAAAREAAEMKKRALIPALNGIAESKRKYIQESQDLKMTQANAINQKKNATTRKIAEQNTLAKLQAQPDPLAMKPVMERELAALFTKITAAAEDLVEAYCSWTQAVTAHAAPDLSARELNDQIDKMGAAARERLLATQKMEEVVEAHRQGVGRLKAAMDSKHADAKALTGWPIPAALEQKFAEMSNDSAVLRAEVARVETEAEELVVNDPGALLRYQQRCAEISSSERELARVTGDREISAAQIDQVKEKWVSELRAITATVNAKFSAAFPSVGCAGEVVLREAENDDFAQYAIDIRVKFRESEELSTLDANRQSGGERSVSTILYLVALQEVAAAPFRVVDEINQGMDPVNERKVFRLLVDAATAPDTPQCFLLTPKLLPDLPFSAQVTVLQIMNGVNIKEVAQGFRQDRLLGNRVANLVAAR